MYNFGLSECNRVNRCCASVVLFLVKQRKKCFRTFVHTTFGFACILITEEIEY